MTISVFMISITVLLIDFNCSNLRLLFRINVPNSFFTGLSLLFLVLLVSWCRLNMLWLLLHLERPLLESKVCNLCLPL